MSLGHVMIGGRRFEVTGMELRHSQVELTIEMPPGPKCEGPITVFGADGCGLWQGSIHKVPRRWVPWVLIYGMRQAAVLNTDQVTDLRDLPGYPREP
jgi:hypothetical protein